MKYKSTDINLLLQRREKLIILLVIPGVIYTALYLKPRLSFETINSFTTENKEENTYIEDVGVNYGKVTFTGKNLNSSICSRKFILLTSQRSGSTWFCSLLNQQEGITCGGRLDNKTKVKPYKFKSELLRLLSKLRHDWTDVKWSEFEKILDTAFGIACKSKSALSIGFKVMYGQIPLRLLENGKFENYLRKNDVSIIHLVREAKILKIDSESNARLKSIWHAFSKSDAAALRDTPKLPWTEKIITKMLNLENLSTQWQRRIYSIANISVYYLSYESLLEKNNFDKAFCQIFGFLTNKIPNSSSIITDTNLFQIHKPLCSDRIENYENFRAHDKVRESRTAAACDMLQMLNNVH